MTGSPETTDATRAPVPAFPSEREPRIVAVGGEWLVVLKPAGMHCLAGTAPERSGGGVTLASWLACEVPGLAAVGVDRTGNPSRAGECGLVHRLDSATSGLVLVARSDAALSHFLQAQERSEFRKFYRLLGCPSDRPLPGSRPPRWSPSFESPESFPLMVSSRFRAYGEGRKRVACLAEDRQWTSGGRKTCGTIYSTEFIHATITTGPDGVVAFDCRAVIAKGFRHQIRAHAAWIGIPLAGDYMYGGAEADRLYLHATGMTFPDPDGGRVAVGETSDDDR